MGVDIHEWRRVHDAVDRNPNSPGAREEGRSGIQQAPYWVQEKAKAAHRRRQAEALYARRYLGAE